MNVLHLFLLSSNPILSSYKEVGKAQINSFHHMWCHGDNVCLIKEGCMPLSTNKGDGYLKNSNRNQSYFFSFRTIVYLFGRDVDLISLKMFNLNDRKINRKGYFKGDSSTGHVQFEFSQLSQMYTNRHGRHLTADRCFSHCTELIMENHTHHVNLTCRKANVTSRFFRAVQLSWIIISCI